MDSFSDDEREPGLGIENGAANDSPTCHARSLTCKGVGSDEDEIMEDVDQDQDDEEEDEHEPDEEDNDNDEDDAQDDEPDGDQQEGKSARLGRIGLTDDWGFQ